MDLWQLILRAIQFLWVLLITALIGNVIALNIDGPMAAINFTMFVAVLSWLAVLYGIAASVFTSLAIPIVMLALDGAAALFTLIAGIVLAARLKAVNCSNPNQGPGWIGYGAENVGKRCREIQASTAFLWFLFATFAATLALAFLSFRRVGGGARSHGPGMSQVRV
ncbi:marvel domain-containing protein [Coniochaeta sp. 2T2.1]|nr:marvel domain-containing protein [Coniochaeta sp. 2T2.1]